MIDEGRKTVARHCAVLVAACLWAGFLAGVSFLATPVKFLAPSLSLPTALDVGRQTFHALNRCEIALAAILLVLLLRAPGNRLTLALAGLASLVVLAQTFWLLPALDARVAIILAGSTPPPSLLHTVYVIAEAARLLALLIVGWLAMRAVLASVRGGVPGARAGQDQRPPVQNP
jgi:hypothetical protein